MNMNYQSTKILELGSCAFRQWKADSHCKYVHGYRLIAKFWFSCDKLDERNWVVDFGGLKELKQVLEKQFDHTFCVSADDPKLELFKQLDIAGVCDLRVMQRGVGIERTAEWCFDVADAHVRGITSNRCWVDRVEVWEHDKNSAIVIPFRSSGEVTYTEIQNHITAGNAESAATNSQPVHQIPTEQPRPDQADSNRRAAAVGNKVTTGLSNPFGGTTWGL